MPRRALVPLTVLLSIAFLLGRPMEASAADRWIRCRGDGTADPVLSASSQPSTARLRVADLLPDPSERFGRSLNFKLELLDQEDFFIQEVTLPSGRNGEDRDTLIFRPNPDRYLAKGTLTLDLSKLFQSPSELKTAYETVQELPEAFDTAHDPLAVERARGEVTDLFAWARPKDRWKRLLSGISVYAAVADRPTLSNGSPLPEPILAEDRYNQTYGLKIDPSKWFVTASDRASAFAATEAYARAYGKPDVLKVVQPCSGQVDRRCLDSLSEIAGPQTYLWALLPVFELKSVDQFDFIQTGQRFLTGSFQDKTLETYTLTWDLGRAFGAATERAAAAKLIAALEKVRALEEPSIDWQRNRRIPVAPDELIYLQFSGKGGLSPTSWKVASDNCGGEEGEVFGGTSFSKGGLLAGYPLEVPMGCQFTVTLRDAVGQEDLLTCTVAP